MIDFNKGFEEYESLGDKKPKKKEDKVFLSKEMSGTGLLSDTADISQLELLYNNVRTFLIGQFDLVAKKNEKNIDFKTILTYVEKICTAFEGTKNLGGFIRLCFEHDEYEDNYIYTHSVNVCFICLRIALELNFSRKRLLELAICSLFHDIGMMKITPSIWNKEGTLSSSEYKEVQEHPLFGEGLFTNVDGIDEVVPLVIGQHQEKIDGSGYPGHLTIDNIHYLSRLISLVDAYETQTHTRKWKNRFLPDTTIQDLLDHQTGKFDPHFMKALLKVVSIYPEGTFVKISSGEICKVIETNKDKPMRPIVDLVYDNTMKPLATTRQLDLSKQMLVHVVKCVEPSAL